MEPLAYHSYISILYVYGQNKGRQWWWIFVGFTYLLCIIIPALLSCKYTVSVVVSHHYQELMLLATYILQFINVWPVLCTFTGNLGSFYILPLLDHFCVAISHNSFLILLKLRRLNLAVSNHIYVAKLYSYVFCFKVIRYVDLLHFFHQEPLVVIV